MTNHLLIESGQECITIEAYTARVCFTREECLPTCLDWILQDCNNMWNCNLCQQDCCYFHPYLEGDKLHFQTQFFDEVNEDRENPTLGWGDVVVAEVRDCEGNLISDDHTTFASDYSVGCAINEKCYQNIIIDTNGLPDSFYFCFTPKNKDGELLTNQSACSHMYTKALCGQNTVEVCSEYSGTDCCGHYYSKLETSIGTSNFAYTNCTRYWGTWTDTGGSVSKETVGSKNVSGTVSCVKQLALGKKIPSSIKNMLVKQHLAGDKVYINGEEFDFKSVSVENRLTQGTMFLFAVDGTQECEKNYRC